MVLSWFYYGVVIVFSWCCYSVTIALLWCKYSDDVVLLLCYRGFVIILPDFYSSSSRVALTTKPCAALGGAVDPNVVSATQLGPRFGTIVSEFAMTKVSSVPSDSPNGRGLRQVSACVRHV
jgi:hypothetical protein